MLPDVGGTNPLVGRETELRRLAAAFEGARAGVGRLVRIVGEPGIGKTRLADELAEIATGAGARVVWGRCWEAGGAPAFWPWTQITRALGVGDSPAELDGAPTAVAAASSAAEAEEARFRVFDAVARTLARESATAPLVVVVDDAHAADVPSLMLLRFVANGLRPSKLLIVLTHREIEARLHPEVGALLARIARDGETVALRRLDASDVAEWLRGVGRPESGAARVHRATEGNPLFVEELLAMSGDGGWDLASSDAVRIAISEHLARLTDGARGVLEVAAVVGREASRAELTKLTDAGMDVDGALAAAAKLGVIEPRGEERYAFRHILLRDALYASLDAPRRAVLHARVADLLARRAELGDHDSLARAAHHDLLAARAGGEIARAVERARRAAAHALERVAYEQAAEVLDAAVLLLESRGPIETAEGAALLIELGEALFLSGLGPRGRDVCARAAGLAKGLRDAPLVVRAALIYGTEITTGRRDERMIALLRDAMEALGAEDSPVRAHVMARLASALIPLPVHDLEPESLAREALAMARRAGDRLSLLHTLQFASAGIGFRADAAERRALVHETVALALALDRPAIAAQSLPWAIACDLEHADLVGCERHFAELAGVVERMRLSHYRVRLPLARAMRASLAGAWEDADLAFSEVATLLASSETPLTGFLQAFGLLGRHFARRDRAQLEAAREGIERVFEGMATPGRAFSSLLLALRASCGACDMESARARVGATLREILGFVQVSVLPAVGPAAWSAVLVEDRELVATLYDPVGESARRGGALIVLAGCAGSLGPTSLLLGEMAAILDRRDEAAAHYERSIVFADAIGASLYAGRARARRDALGVRPVSPPASAESSAAPASPPALSLDQDGEMWTLRAGAESWHLKPSKGFAYLATLLAHPGQEVHVAQLVGAPEQATGDAGPSLDEAAKASYRLRATDLRAALDEATTHGDVGRAEKARAELDLLGEELARAVGLGGRDRKAASDVERMRVNVQRRLRDALDRVRAQSPAIGRYLDASVRTGSFCSFTPAWSDKGR